MLRCHSEVVPLKCSFCVKNFPTEAQIKRHEKCHAKKREKFARRRTGGGIKREEICFPKQNLQTKVVELPLVPEEGTKSPNGPDCCNNTYDPRVKYEIEDTGQRGFSGDSDIEVSKTTLVKQDISAGLEYYLDYLNSWMKSIWLPKHSS